MSLQSVVVVAVVRLVAVAVVVESCKPRFKLKQVHILCVLVWVAQAVQEHQATKAATTVHLVALQASQQAVAVAVHSKTQTVKTAVVVVVVATVFQLAA
jgi:hypothetical protein